MPLKPGAEGAPESIEGHFHRGITQVDVRQAYVRRMIKGLWRDVAGLERTYERVVYGRSPVRCHDVPPLPA